MSFCFLYNVVSENYSVQNSPWGGGGSIASSRSNARYLLLVSCYFTKWLDAIPINSIDAKTVATKLIERFISVFGGEVGWCDGAG